MIETGRSPIRVAFFPLGEVESSIDGRPLIRGYWPESGDAVHNGPVHTLDETAKYMWQHGMPHATKQIIQDIERTALRKLRHHPLIRLIYQDRRFV
jgi:hypothetical protein